MSGNSNSGRFGDSSDVSMDDNGGYALSGRIMLSTIVVLFFVVLLAFVLHLYARWMLLRARNLRSPNGRRNRRRRQLVFYADNNAPATRGLDARVLKSLPVFTFSAVTNPDSAVECAVCLSEFEENESGRVLPKCKHSFHVECIDMWFHSHSTCPLCRTSVEGPVPVSENPGDVVLTVNEPSGGESGSNRGSDLRSTCDHEEQQAATSAVESRRKLSVEVPRRNTEGFASESSGCDSGPSQSYKSPMTRMLSFKRILSRERRASGSINVSESDIEGGGEGGLSELKANSGEVCDSVDKNISQVDELTLST